MSVHGRSDLFWKRRPKSRGKGSGTRFYSSAFIIIYGEIDKARDAWLKSVDICESAWALRNLAMLYKSEYGEAELNRLTDEKYPLPRSLDFRMHE